MARTEQEIYDAILADKDAEVGLANLNSGSATAIWRLWAWITAKAIQLHETLWDVFTAEVDAKAKAVIPGTIPWYIAECLAWQYGYGLEFIDLVPGYAVDDAAAQIITRAAVEEAGGLIVKVSKSDGAGGLAALSAGEQAGFAAYFDQVKMAGTAASILSLNPDLVRCTGTFYYDPQQDLTAIKADLDARILAYLSGLEYNSYFYQKKLDDIIQETLGYVDHQLDTLEAREDAGIAWSAVGRRYRPLAGYLKTDAAFSGVLVFTAVTDILS